MGKAQPISGKKLTYYVTSWGEEITGAVRSNSDGRLRPSGRGSPAFGPAKDERLMVHRFRLWKSKQTGGEPPPYEIIDGVEIINDLRDPIYWGPGKDYWRDYYHNLILSEPAKAALELDVPHLAFYPATPVCPQWTLEELYAHWADNARNAFGERLDKKYVANTKTAWTEFLKRTGYRYARDFEPEKMEEYKNWVMAQYDAGKSSSWVSTRFKAISTMLNYGKAYSKKDKPDYQKALAETAILSAPAKTANPKPIEPEDFHKLYEAASKREKAALLLGLNACMHGGECCQLLKEEINLDKLTLSTRRSKNQRPRVAALWKRTADAVRLYWAESPSNSPYVFVAEGGKEGGSALTSEGLRQCIVAARERAELPAYVTFEGLRDAAFTVAEETDAHHAKFVAGHKTGMSEKYVLRQASNRQVIACCEAIEAHFWPAEKKA